MLLSTISFVIMLLAGSTTADNCGLSLYGNSYIGLSEGASIFSTNSESSQHTFDFWFNPQQQQRHDQSLLQTGIVQSNDGTQWAIEFTFRTTIWQHAQSSPSGSILYVDIWLKTPKNKSGLWQKSRYYIVLGGDSFPWLHVSFSSGGGSILLNGKYKRMDKYSPAYVEETPGAEFALGKGFSGAFDEVRIWNSKGEIQADVYSSLCLDEIQSKLELYLPFNECKGNTFLGHTNVGSTCALLYNINGLPSPSPVDRSTGEWEEDGIVTVPPSRPTWISASPVVAQECTPRLEEGKCSYAKYRVRNSVSAHKQETSTDVGKYSSNPLTNIISSFGLLGTIAIIIVLFSIATTAAVVIFRRYNPKEDATRPRSKSIHTV